MTTPLQDGWMPIETAPKDGTWVVGYFGDSRGDDPCDAAVCHFTFRGWLSDDGKELVDPTHWMPLPPPPEVQP